MYFRYILVTLLVASWPDLAISSEGEAFLLEEAVIALYRGLQYMEDNISGINLDGAFGCRLLAELIDAFLLHSPQVFDVLGDYFRLQLEVLSRKAINVVARSIPFLKLTEPKYYASVGRLLDGSKVLLWYPSRTTELKFKEKPLPCAETVFNESLSDQCLQNLLGTWVKETDQCNVTQDCLDYMTKPKQRGYTITHQALYFIMMEKNNCLRKSSNLTIPESLQLRLCTNVLRDAEEIADADYPLRWADLFMEQIGLCGIWGFKDFYRAEWLENILQWQKPSGCYADRIHWICEDKLMKDNKTRVRREEKTLADGCLSHKTTVALLAITASIRFNAEKISGMAYSTSH